MTQTVSITSILFLMSQLLELLEILLRKTQPLDNLLITQWPISVILKHIHNLYKYINIKSVPLLEKP